MKLTPQQLEQHLKQQLAKVYLICGDEPFLVQEALQQIRQKAVDNDYQDRLRLDLESETDLDNCYSSAYTPPLLGQKRLLELHWKIKLGKTGQEFLNNYAAQPSPYCVLLVRLGKLDSKTEQTQWFKALEKNAFIISIWPLPAYQLPAWIVQRAKSQSFNIQSDAAQLLAHYVEGNLQAAAQEITKLSLLDIPSIDRQTLEAMIVDQACFNAFDLVEQALAGKGAQVLRILQYLQKEGSEPLQVLGAFTYELRNIAKIAKELKQGGNLNSLFSQYRIRLNKQGPIRDFLKRSADQDLHHLFLRAGEIDRIVKGALSGQVWTALQDLSLAVAGHPTTTP